MQNIREKTFFVKWTWEITISVPKDLSVKEVVSGALATKMWIPWILNGYNRILISCDWHYSWKKPPFKVIHITRKSLSEILNK